MKTSKRISKKDIKGVFHSKEFLRKFSITEKRNIPQKHAQHHKAIQIILNYISNHTKLVISPKRFFFRFFLSKKLLLFASKKVIIQMKNRKIFDEIKINFFV